MRRGVAELFRFLSNVGLWKAGCRCTVKVGNLVPQICLSLFWRLWHVFARVHVSRATNVTYLNPQRIFKLDEI